MEFAKLSYTLFVKDLVIRAMFVSLYNRLSPYLSKNTNFVQFVNFYNLRNFEFKNNLVYATINEGILLSLEV